MIELRSVTRRFDQTVAVDSLSLSIRDGERVALVGPSGSGKTTLLRLVNGMIAPDSGIVTVKGYCWGTTTRTDREIRAQIGMVYQHFNLVPRLSVARNVQAGRLGKTSAPGAIWTFLRPEFDEIKRVLATLDISDKLHKRTEKLSGGEQQRVAIARALFQDPEILLADEPIASVDPSLSQWILDLLNNWAIEKNSTLVVCLHQVDFARNNFERIIGIRDGAIAFDLLPGSVTDEMLRELYENENLRTIAR